MSRKKALVVGASGVIGHAIVRHLQALTDWDVIGLARRPAPAFMSDVPWISVDIADAASVKAQSALLSGVTHVFYAAYVPQKDLAQESTINASMLRGIPQGCAR
jgi:uncharacterized protein YbjT (DUF2867 family)